MPGPRAAPDHVLGWTTLGSKCRCVYNSHGIWHWSFPLAQSWKSGRGGAFLHNVLLLGGCRRLGRRLGPGKELGTRCAAERQSQVKGDVSAALNAFVSHCCVTSPTNPPAENNIRFVSHSPNRSALWGWLAELGSQLQGLTRLKFRDQLACESHQRLCWGSSTISACWQNSFP